MPGPVLHCGGGHCSLDLAYAAYTKQGADLLLTKARKSRSGTEVSLEAESSPPPCTHVFKEILTAPLPST